MLKISQSPPSNPNTPATVEKFSEHLWIRFFWLFLIFLNSAVAQNIGNNSSLIPQSVPRLVVNSAHTQYIFSVAISPNGEFAVTGGKDNTLRLWHLKTGRELRQFVGHSGPINAVAFHPNGRQVLSASADSTIRLWSIENGKELKIFKGHSLEVTTLAVSLDQKFVLSGGWDKTMRLWDIESTKELRSFVGHEGWVTSVSFSPNGQMALSGGLENWRLWDVASGKKILQIDSPKFKWPGGIIVSRPKGTPATFLPDGKRILLGGWDGSLKILDIASGQFIQSFPESIGEISSIAVDQLGNQAASVGADRLVHLWDIKTGSELKKFVGHGVWVTSVAFSTDGKSLLSAAFDETVRVWDIASGNEIQRLGQHMSMPGLLAFSSAGDQLTTTRAYSIISDVVIKNDLSNDLSLSRIWNLASGSEPKTISSPPPYDRALALSPDGRLALTRKEDKSIAILDTRTGQELQRLKGFNHWVTQAAFFPNNKRVLTGSEDGFIILWDIAGGKELKRFGRHVGGVGSIVISLDSKRFISSDFGGNHDIVIWDIDNGFELRRKRGNQNESVYALGLSPEGKRLLSSDHKGNLTVWDIANGKNIHTLSNHTSWVNSIAISQNGKLLLSGSEDHTIGLWDIENGLELQMLKGHSDAITSVAFHPNGRYFASASKDQTVKVWRISDGKEIVTLMAKPNGDWFVTDPEGRFDASDLEEVQQLHWIMPDDPLTPIAIEAFMKDYYEPRLLSRILSGEALNPVRPLTSLKRSQPEVKIISVLPVSTDPRMVRVKVQAAPISRAFLKEGKQVIEQTSVHDLRLFRDGQLVGYADGVLAHNGDEPYIHEYNIHLPSSGLAQNIVFSAYAFNDDRVKSDTVRSIYKAPVSLPSNEPPRGTAYVIAMGVNRHENSEWDLNFAAADAHELIQQVSASLESTKKYKSVVPISLISDGSERNASKDALRVVLNRLGGVIDYTNSNAVLTKISRAGELKTATPDDIIIISFSGHGFADSKGQFHLITQDTGAGVGKSVTPELLKSSISSEDLSLWLKDIDAGDISMIVDACQSEASIQTEGFKPGPMGSRGLGQLAYDKGLRILAASQSDRPALENDLIKHGLLTYSLVIDGLKQFQADHDPRDGSIMMDEWLKYGLIRVPTLANDILFGKPLARGWKVRLVVEETINPSGTITIRDANRPSQQPAFFDFSKALRTKKVLSSSNIQLVGK